MASTRMSSTFVRRAIAASTTATAPSNALAAAVCSTTHVPLVAKNYTTIATTTTTTSTPLQMFTQESQVPPHSILLTKQQQSFFSTQPSIINNNTEDDVPLVYTYKEDVSKMTNEQLSDNTTIPGWSLIHTPPRHKRDAPRGSMVGTVVSDKMQKTVNVAVDRYRIVPKYGKRKKYTRKFMAHDEKEVCSVGDLVMIVPCQKLSRHKHFMVKEIIRAKGQL
mmetsp:Transcript_17559/g.25133  ORF Transcript_17559/g.25133 Transcript_17559/m.25133 type:complete len:221 (+) Transcript_17559:1309-1971(+)